MTLSFVLSIGVAVGLLYVAVVANLFLVRFRNSAHVRHREQLEGVWLPLLADGQEQIPTDLPPLRRRDLVPFLVLWNQLQESFVGEAKSHLNTVARRLGIDRTAHQLLQGHSLSRRLLAVSTLGHLGERSVWNDLVRMTGDADGLLSLAAARALTRIDAPAAMPVILPLVAQRRDWSRNYVLGMLSELGADVVSRPLTEAAMRVPIEQADRLLQYFSVAHVSDAVPVVRSIITRTKNVECLAACLRVFADVDDLDTVREYLYHPSWQVRVQAVNVLARLGSARDFAALALLLTDAEWWVRYRTARAMCALPGVDMARIQQLSTEHHDPFARDMLVHVLAEAHA
ncbi:MAG TPA: HEAT repeat domain-containing protein [Vicinamibacterales bacterium]|nr:HEAT repeat domain-containing protein [Vicinamibacterales bacterium]